MASDEKYNWDLDDLLLDDLPQWDPLNNVAAAFIPPPSVQSDESLRNNDCIKESSSRKRSRSGACSASESKAYKEKLRRDRLQERFQELSSILEPGRAARTDKVVILSDAVRMVIQLREEAQKLKQQYGDLQEKVNELKAEKNEVRDEKLMLKAEKEKLEQQVKALSTPHGFLPHPPPIHAPFVAQPQVIGSKMMPFVGYSGIPMWQFMPPTAVDTSEDKSLRPPVA